MKRSGTMLLGVFATVAAICVSAPAMARDEAHVAKAREMIKKGAAYLRTQQDADSGGWSVPAPAGGSDPTAKGEPGYPAITGLAMIAIMNEPGVTSADSSVQQGLKYLLNNQQENGGIFDRVVPSYSTSIAISTLSRIDSPRAKNAMVRATAFLRSLQWSEESVKTDGFAESPSPVTKDHPYYGGIGYGRHGRPDLSNLGMMMQAMHDAGVSPDDPSLKRAVEFLQRTQMLDQVNDMPYAKGSKQGGFIYATVENAQSVDGRAGQSMVKDQIEETLDDGTKVSRLRCYGSMTYAGFKSYLYAQLPKDDVRVQAAYNWIRHNYTLKENPGMGQEGLYYYFVTMSRALKAWGEPTIGAVNAEGAVVQHRWAAELIDRLAELQNEDGSFRSVHARWMESNPVLITSYALIALGEAEKMEAAAGSPAK